MSEEGALLFLVGILLLGVLIGGQLTAWFHSIIRSVGQLFLVLIVIIALCAVFAERGSKSALERQAEPVAISTNWWDER